MNNPEHPKLNELTRLAYAVLAPLTLGHALALPERTSWVLMSVNVAACQLYASFW